MKLLRAALIVALCAGVVGCRALRRVPDKKTPPPPKPLEPIEIDWADPGSVVEGFFDAKKRGDWRKAFSCCDFEERLGAEEAKKIRDEWKKEAPTWPDTYRFSDWIIIEATVRGDYALVSVEHIERAGPGGLEAKQSGFDELLKHYGKRWKITEFEVMPR